MLRTLGQRRALRRTLGPPPAGRRETPLQREALPHKDAILNTRAYFRNRILSNLAWPSAGRHL